MNVINLNINFFCVFFISIFLFISSLILNAFFGYKNIYLNIISFISLIPWFIVYIRPDMLDDRPRKGTLKYYIEKINDAKLNGILMIHIKISNYEIVNKLQALRYDIVPVIDNKNVYTVYLR